MKRTHVEVIQCYRYDSYDEFENHYKEITKKGWKPSSSSSQPDYYSNKDMDSYFAQYHKYKSNYS